VLLCVIAGIGFAQTPPRQDPAALALAKSIYARSFTELRAAKTMEDMHQLSDELDSKDWIFVDRFGRTMLTKQQADRDLESMLKLPPERRVSGMDIIWAEQDSDRLMVLAWINSHENDFVDSTGDYGPKGSKHRVTESTLVRDLFTKTAKGWTRVQHDKLVPNGTIIAVNGKPTMTRVMTPVK
jgi:hypothetical protein